MTSVIAPKEVLPPKLAGKAIYLELEVNPTLSESEKRKVSWEWDKKPTKQVVIFPSWLDDSGTKHSAVVMHRVVSEATPRAQWGWSERIRPSKATSAETTSYFHEAYFDYQFVPKSDQGIMPEGDLLSAIALTAEIVLKKLVVDTTYRYPIDPETGEPNKEAEREQYAFVGWVVREDKPLAVELTDEDLNQVIHQTTPQAVVRRINKVRSAIAGFPTKLA